MKKLDLAYWILTALFSAFMIFSAYDNILVGERSVQFIHGWMGFPEYFIPWLGWAKLLGAVALLLPMLPSNVKEWAYFGFFIDLATATYAFIRLGSEPSGYAFMVLFIGVLIAAYALHRKRLARAR